MAGVRSTGIRTLPWRGYFILVLLILCGAPQTLLTSASTTPAPSTSAEQTTYFETSSVTETGILQVYVNVTSYTVPSGTSVTLACFVSPQTSDTTVDWEQDFSDFNIPISIDGIKYTGSTLSNPSLTINNTFPGDSGTYVCTASNFMEQASSDPVTLTVTEGGTCAFCNYNGFCSEGPNGTECTCTALYSGEFCGFYNICAETGTCASDETCIQLNITTDGFHCFNGTHITDGYEPFCRQCNNRGDCITINNQTTCSCGEFGFEGDECEFFAPCQETCPGNSTCVQINSLGDFRCLEENEYLADCEFEYGCDDHPCVFNNSNLHCQCREGFTLSFGKCNDINECRNADRNNCSQQCVNTQGSFECTCFNGYIMNGTECEDINECTNSSLNNCSDECYNFPGGFNCTCFTGYQWNGSNCTDINECSNSSLNNCPQECVDNDGGFLCECFPGFVGNGSICVDTNECSNHTLNNCSQKCNNFPGGFNCSCFDGYTWNVTDCVDVNECLNDTLNNCSQKCDNSLGGFNCSCFDGYTWNATDCVDVNECLDINLNNCSQKCNNSPGGFNCSCFDGYTWNVTDCVDINECLDINLNNCSQKCDNYPGGFNCSCFDGYTWNVTDCVDVNECSNIALNNCSQKCDNSPGGFNCSCFDGYTWNVTDCVDVNECLDINLNNCSQKCDNYPGGFNCSCFDGYTWNVTDCVDVNECLNDTLNNCSQKCDNSPGGYNCSCFKGYILTGTACVDVNECLNNTLNNCIQKCDNFPGGFNCSCFDGYISTGTACVDVNECSNIALNNCSQNCNNFPGGFNCTCFTGYEWNGTTCNDVNECSNTTHIPCPQDCVNSIGSYQCVCFDGYTENGTNCDDINECLSSRLNNCSQNCNNFPGGYNCSCFDGYVWNGTVCNDINECLDNSLHNCSQKCNNLPGTFNCSCYEGYFLNGTSCDDVNECLNNSLHNCSQKCNNFPGGFDCACFDGYDGNGTICVDVNECSNITLNNCSQDCYNYPGGFNCSCFPGFELNGTTCGDINECSNTTLNGCDQECLNSPGSFQCVCFEGFQLNGSICDDINECTNQSLNNCSQGCSNFPGGYECYCFNGYQTNGSECVDINECTEGSHNCSQDCVNNPGGFHCECYRGYVLNGTDCEDINECTNETLNNCSQECYNLPGGFDCNCQMGYTWNGTTCNDVNECSNTTHIPCPQDCVNSIGSYQCVCFDGYTENGTNCDDINECLSTRLNNCSQNCYNFPGGYNCSCFDGYVWNGTVCNDINECLDNTLHNCSQKCNNFLGGYYCSCFHGYAWNRTACIDVNECTSTTLHNCSQKCNNLPGDFNCSCFDGYIGDGIQCNDVDECQTDVTLCNGTCINNNGGFRCNCTTGYTERAGYCFDIDECLNTTAHGCTQKCENNIGSYSCACWDGFISDNGQCILSVNQIGVNVRSLLFSVRDIKHTWDTSLLNRSSKYFSDITQAYQSNMSLLMANQPDYRDIYIVMTRSGSVIVDGAVVASNSANLTQYGEIIRTAVRSSFLGNIEVDPNYLMLSQEVGYINSVSVTGPQHTVLSGSDVEVLCEIEAVALPGKLSVKWKLNGIDVYPLANSRVQTEMISYPENPARFTNKLIFNPIIFQDAGKAECFVNVGTLQANSSATLAVFDVDIQPNYVSVELGTSVNITCTIRGTNINGSLPAITWCKNGDELSPSSGVTLSSSSDNRTHLLTIASTEDSAAAYGCGLARTNAQSLCQVEMTLFVYRPADQPCVKSNDSNGIIWNQTFPDEIAYSSCSAGYTGDVSRVCVRNGYVGEWGNPDYSRCVKEQLKNISNQVDQIQSGLAVIPLADLLHEMSNATATIVTADQLTVGDLGSSVDIIAGIANISEKQQANISATETEEFVATVDYLLNADSSDKWASLQTGNNEVPAASVMEAVSTFGKSVVKSLTTSDLQSVRKNNIIAEFRKSPPQNIVFPFNSTSSTLHDDFGASLLMLQETITNGQLNETGTVDYIATYYKTLSEFIPVDVQGTGRVEGQRLASGILALTLTSGPQANLNPPLELQYLHSEELVGERTCVFWDFSLPNGGEWSSKGCVVVFADVTTTRCHCDHLTNFAVMMSPYTNVNSAHHKILGMISIIGCAISLTGMALTVLCHIYCWRSVKSDKSAILVNMCIALILALILFLAGVEQTSNKTICTVIAVALHYMFLAVFFLMLTEGIAVAMSVLFVFSSSSKLRYLLPIGWGIPAIIVGISTGATQLEGYGNENFCWLSVSNSVLFAFIVPALAVIVANFIIAVLVFRALFSTRVVMSKTKKGKLMTAVRSVAVLAPLLGLTWIFGVLSVNEDTVMFQYFFVVFNSLQGLFIFIFHCLLSKVMRDTIRRKIPCLGLSAQDKSKFSKFSSTNNRFKTNPTSESEVSGKGKCLIGATIDSVTAFGDGEYKIDKNGKDFHRNGNDVSKPDTSRNEFKQNGIRDFKQDISEKGTYQSKKSKTSKNLQVYTNSDSGSHPSGSQRDSLSDKSDRLKYMQWIDDGKTSVSFRAAPFGGIRSSPANSEIYNPARL